MELILKLKSGEIITVYYDNEDHELVSRYKWRLKGRGNKFYAATYIYLKEKQNNKSLFMHNLIMGVVGIDHKNGNGCDNRRVNLREATPRENAKNMQLSKLNKWGVKGVSYCNAKKLYSVHITNDYKHIFLGYFSCLIEAAKKYNEAAIKYHGEFANLNKITKSEIERLSQYDLGIIISRRNKKTSKTKGVSVLSNGKYRARLVVKGIEIKIGVFNTEKEAEEAYLKTKKQLNEKNSGGGIY